MRVPLQWLNEFIDAGLSVKELAHRLTMAGLEVEAIEGGTAPGESEDCVFEVNVTPNRPDCLSILGIAREVSAITGLPVKFPEHVIGGEDFGFEVEIKDEELCSRYAGRVIKDITIAASPESIRKRLQFCGVRPANNIVDITNYVLFELGQPLHAFDLDALKGKKIIVDKAPRGISIVTLDGSERKLPEESLLIWDTERPVAVAGVMGGKETEVTESTKNIFLESAWFYPGSVRRTSKALGLSSESSYRFERGVDIEMVEIALERAAFLMNRFAGGRVGKKIDVYPRRFVPCEIKVSAEKVNRILGTDMPASEMLDCLRRLCLNPEQDGGYLKATPPAFRLDVKRDADVIEEIARIYGYGKIPAGAPRAVISSEGISRRFRLISRVKEAVRMAGYTEAVNYSFMNSRHLDTLGLPEDDRRRKAVAIKNPLRKEDSLLRTTLVPSLMETLKYNLFRGIKDIRVFEVSRVFEDMGEPLPFESLRLGGIFYREKTPELWKEQAGDFYLVKGALESVFEELRLKGCSFSASTETFLHPGKSADIYLSGQRAGFIGALSPSVTERLDIKPKADIMVFELDMDSLLLSAPASLSFEPIPRFPCVERDIAIVVDEGMKADEIIGLIKAYPSGFIEDTSVFDYYKGANIPKGKKSLAFSVRYRSKDRTLTDEEVETVHSGLLEHLTEKAGGEIRK